MSITGRSSGSGISFVLPSRLFFKTVAGYLYWIITTKQTKPLQRRNRAGFSPGLPYSLLSLKKAFLKLLKTKAPVMSAANLHIFFKTPTF